jgi:uncharacterized alpha-E superfamily protein
LNNPLLARYAECMFWLSRFVERAENLARILEVNETHARDRAGVSDWLSIVHINADQARFSETHAKASADSVIRFYLTEADNPTSIVSAIANARENARTLRPLVSTEMWVHLNVFHNRLKEITPAELAPGGLSPLLNEIKGACQTFAGVTEGTFYRDQAWYFYRLGKYIERADQTTRLLDTKYRLLTSDDDGAGPDRIGQWHALLRSASGYHAFRRVYSSGLSPARVVRFLLFDPNFPRSVYLCVREVDAALYELKSRFGVRAGDSVADALDSVRAILAGRSTEEVLGAGLHDFLDFLQSALIEVTDRLAGALFGQPAPPPPEQRSVAPPPVSGRAQIAS